MLVEASVEQVTKQLKAELKNPLCPCEGAFTKRHAQLFITEPKRRFWSPFVSLSLSQEESFVRIRGVIGPAPNMWIMFISGYAFLGFLVFVSSMWGISEWIIGQPTIGLFLVPVFAFLMVIWFFLSQLGQKLAREQIEGLRHLLDRAFETFRVEDPL